MNEPNISRTPNARRVVDERVYLYLSEDTLDDLIAACVRSVDQQQRTEPDRLKPAESAWCHSVFALIATGGLAGPKAIEEIFELQFRDLVSASQGYIDIPRADGHYRIYIPRVTAFFILRLLNHLTRGRGPGKNRQGEFPANGFVLPGRADPVSPITLDEQRRYQEMFRSWLWRQGKATGVYVPVGRLIALARERVLRDYSPPIAATLLGLHLLNPTPVEQDDEISDYLTELNWQWVIDPGRAGENRLQRKLARQSSQGHSVKTNCTNTLPIGFLELRSMISKFARTDKLKIRSARRRVIGKLEKLAGSAESDAGKMADESWAEFFQKNQSAEFDRAGDAINTCLLSRWFILQAKSRAPNTVSARLADLLIVIRQNPDRSVAQWKEDELLKVIGELTVTPSRRERIADSWKQFFRFLASNFGLPVSDIAAWKLRNRPAIKEYRLITQHDFEHLLAYLFHTPKVGPAVAASLLIGYYFGLRVSEICRLRIGDLWLDGTPTVLVRPSKRGRSRFVEGIQIPNDVILFLQGLRTSRLDEQDNDYSAFLLVDSKYDPLPRSRLMSLMADALAATGIKDSAGQARSAMHLLRHACANRWWALGVPLIDIAHKMGHRSPDTTIRNYLHIAPFLQREQCRCMPDLDITICQKGIANSLGITIARLRQLERSMFSPLRRAQDDKKDDAYSLGSAIQSLEQFLVFSQ